MQGPNGSFDAGGDGRDGVGAGRIPGFQAKARQVRAKVVVQVACDAGPFPVDGFLGFLPGRLQGIRGLATILPLTKEGTEDEGGGEGASYLGILLGALTVDGWVVIGILAVMGVISFSVMVGKTLFLGRTDKANNVFLERFRASPRTLLDPVAGETLALAEDEAVRHSSIYRLYAIGIREIRHRFEAQQAAGKGTGLTAAALDAIRAAMDAAMVRENQRLNSQIVLLTIAISGGPFLGLLGTVVGVMITFAAIAAAGDVNVNSIAPGIAAALVATVAGLAVAIPALFGYNWLSIRIKNVAADTQVFSDEFLTKSAELYAG